MIHALILGSVSPCISGGHPKFDLERVVSRSKLKFAALGGMMAILVAYEPAAAGDAYYVTPGVGTLGASVKAGYRWSDNMGVTGIVSGFIYSHNTTYSGVPATAKTQLFGTGLILDYYPLGGDLRVSGGLRYSADKVTGTVTDAGTSVGYTAQANTLQPYLGLGYSLPIKSNIALDLDVGAYYTGKTTVTPDRSFNNANISSALSKAQSDLNNTSFYPVAQLGLRFEF